MLTLFYSLILSTDNLIASFIASCSFCASSSCLNVAFLSSSIQSAIAFWIMISSSLNSIMVSLAISLTWIKALACSARAASYTFLSSSYMALFASSQASLIFLSSAYLASLIFLSSSQRFFSSASLIKRILSASSASLRLLMSSILTSAIRLAAFLNFSRFSLRQIEQPSAKVLFLQSLSAGG